jgi:hypothetical protein
VRKIVGRFRPSYVFLCVLSLIALFLASCATARFSAPRDPVSLPGAGASVYFVIPVEANRELVDLLARNLSGGSDASAAIGRARVLYAGVWPDGNLRLAATGSFPAGAASFAFPASQGWTKVRGADSSVWYHSASADAAIPVNDLVCFAKGPGAIEAMLANLKNPPAVETSASFAAYAAASEADGRVGVFVRDGENLLAAILGPDVSLPVSFAELYASRDAESGDYDILATIATADVRSARAMAALFRLALSCEARYENDRVYISGYRISAEKLAETTGSLYFK